jgi:hypothetical protein
MNDNASTPEQIELPNGYYQQGESIFSPLGLECRLWREPMWQAFAAAMNTPASGVAPHPTQSDEEVANRILLELNRRRALPHCWNDLIAAIASELARHRAAPQ